MCRGRLWPKRMSFRCMFEMSAVHVPLQMWWQDDPHPRDSSRKLLSPKLLCVRGTTHMLSDTDWSSGRPVSAVSWMSEARYDGVCQASDWWTRHASLNSTLRWAGSQCNFCRTGAMRLHCRVPVIRMPSGWIEPFAAGSWIRRTGANYNSWVGKWWVPGLQFSPCLLSVTKCSDATAWADSSQNGRVQWRELIATADCL